MRRQACFVALVLLFAAGAAARPEQEDHLSLVPWKVLEPGEDVDAPLVLFWIPSSSDELRRSPLLSSNELTLYSSRCVAMRVVRLNDGARLAKLNVAAQLPFAVLAEKGGHVISAIENDRGALNVFDVEDVVREALDARSEDAEMKLDEAQKLSEKGDVDAALALYREVWEERCVCPRQGREAQKALKKLERR
jgi:hypothetical protein